VPTTPLTLAQRRPALIPNVRIAAESEPLRSHRISRLSSRSHSTSCPSSL
jgi:hypothetical protein